MNEKFLQLDLEKQKRIINAALKEFAYYGYKQASTNSIAKEAGISKGALFLYFNNKANLYVYLLEFYTQYVLQMVEQHQLLQEKDVFKRHRVITELKIKTFYEYPYIVDFIHRAIIEKDPEVYPAISDFINKTRENYPQFLLDIDRTAFKDDIDIDKAIEIIMWTMEGFSNQMRHELINKKDVRDYEQILDVMDEYLTLLKQMFYK